MRSVRMLVCVVVAALVAAFTGRPALATFHFMQIEQVIGGVNGDTTAQAIQLRMRAFGQNFVSEARIVSWDANGQNPIVIIDFASNVPNGATGDRVLIVSPNFANYTNPDVVGDFTMTNLIPADRLAAGRLTFEEKVPNRILWSLAWGGDSYTGPNDGTRDNDSDGNFGPPFDGELPSQSLQALQFQGPANARSTSNQADYAVTAGAAVFTNNARNSFTVDDGTGGGITLTADGTCPGGGPIEVSWSGATPNGQVALLFALSQGSFVIPPGNPCAGTQLGLSGNQLQVGFQGSAGADGSRTVDSNAGAGACGGFLQLLDISTCGLSNVVQIQ